MCTSAQGALLSREHVCALRAACARLVAVRRLVRVRLLCREPEEPLQLIARAALEHFWRDDSFAKETREKAELAAERVVMEIEGYGEVELGFYPNAAPVTVAHIVKLFSMGCYDTNHVFRVDKGFVAQVQSVDASSVQKPLSAECKEEAKKTVPGEFTEVPHVRGILSMGRMSDPNSGGSSFSMLLGRAAHLDAQYTVFGKVLRGDAVLSELEQVKTKKEGIFVMPLERITITRAYVVGSERAPR